MITVSLKVLQDALQSSIVECSIGWFVNHDLLITRRKLVPDLTVSEAGWIVWDFAPVPVGHEGIEKLQEAVKKAVMVKIMMLTLKAQAP